ncbi:MAG: toxin-antitoxin system YwqK family antitoxin [Bacteroidota bacterium]
MRLIKKWRIFLLLLALTSCFVDEEKQSLVPTVRTIVPKDSLYLATELGLVISAGEPFTGTSVEYYPTGPEAVMIDYLAGRKHGLHRKWFVDGTLSFSSAYTDGRRDGITKSWWRNGKLRSQGNYVLGVAQGLHQQWYFSGAKFKEIRLVDGREAGRQQSWRENGKLYNNYEARAGRIFGLKRANLCFSLASEEVQLNRNGK